MQANYTYHNTKAYVLGYDTYGNILYHNICLWFRKINKCVSNFLSGILFHPKVFAL